MTTFLNALDNELNVTVTANGAKAYKSTGSKNLDLFGKIAASRNNVEAAVKAFNLAYKEDPETAARILFWARDIRGGQGERSVFRAIFKDLAISNPDIATKLVPLVPEYGRWDDLLVLEDTLVWDTVLDFITRQWLIDVATLRKGGDNEAISLLGKWLPSINASSKGSKRLGRKIAARLNVNERQYRKTLTAMRERIKIVEQAMCAREWDTIDYSKLPSRAGFMYRKAFAKRDGIRYQSFLDSVKKGEAKINAGTLYPYDIVENCLYKGENSDTLDLMWKALPNYMEGQEFNGLVVADVSGSMMGRPMAVSISLAMYIAERNTGVWKDRFLTFSESPELQTVVGSTIASKVRNLSKASWGMNTDLQKTFDLILNTAVKNRVPESEMPRKIVIVSDMQFDQCCYTGYGRWDRTTNFEAIRDKYEKAGYKLPDLIFWNVNGSDNVPMKLHDSGTCLLSGCSPSILKVIFNDKRITPLSVMEDAVYSERYEPVGRVFHPDEPQPMTLREIYDDLVKTTTEFKGEVCSWEEFQKRIQSTGVLDS